jgi:hypothetical protein
MNRKTLIALGSFIVLAVLAAFALKQPEKGERASDKPRPLPKLEQVDTIEVTKAGSPATVIKNEGGKYKVTAPVAYAADEPIAKAAFEALGKMDVSDLVTDNKAKHAEFEVDDKGVHVIAKKGDKVLADIVIGKTSGPGTMVRLTGKDQVWQASGMNKYTFDKTPADWRDKSVTTFTVADAEQIELAARDGSKATVKKTGTKVGNDDKWEVVESSIKVEKLDDSIPNNIVQALAVWKANDFADGVKPADAGLEPPALTVTVSVKGGKKVTALIGNKKGDDDFYVKTPEAPQIYLVKKYNLDRVYKRPIDLRDKTLCNIADSDVTEIAVTNAENSYTVSKSGSDWKASKPAKLDLDPSKVTPIAGAFKEWKGVQFAEDPSPKATGLVKPKAVIAVKGKNKEACTINVGDETKDKLNYNVAMAKSPDVLLAPKWNVDRILVKVADLKKGSAADATAKAHGMPGGPPPGMPGGHP